MASMIVMAILCFKYYQVTNNSFFKYLFLLLNKWKIMQITFFYKYIISKENELTNASMFWKLFNPFTFYSH